MLKGTCVFCLILAVGLGASASAEVLLHWSLDESSGNTAHDSIGENHGTLRGNTAWAPTGGKFGGAALFDGADDSVRFTAPAGPFPFSDYPFTLMGWCKTTKSTAKAVIVAVVQGTSFYYWVGVQNGRGCVTARNTSGQFEQMGGPTISDNQWHHVCGVYYGPDNRRLFVDGVEATQDTRTITFLTGIRRIAAGALDRDPAGENIVDEMNGAVDDVAIFNEALDVDAIKRYMVGGIPTTSQAASAPSPAGGETDVPRDIALRWMPGDSARAHDVYLGTALDQVGAADRTGPMDILVSQGQTDTTYVPAEPLEYGRTYYWRVDEVNAPPDSTIFKGEVWSFTVEPFAYPISGVTATASSAAANMGPEKTVNGAGLTGDVHSKESETMWLSDPAGPQPTWIRFQFDKVYKLDEMWVWNSNQVVEMFVDFGCRSVTIEYSTDGAAWTLLAGVPEFAQAPGTDGYAHNTTVDFGGVEARYVKLTIDGNFGVLPQYGLSEVRFFHIPVQARAPQPADGAVEVNVEAALNWRPGREATSHAVYFGAGPEAVAAGAVPAGTVTSHSYEPASLDFGTTYHWRVDEVGEARTYPGDPWRFTTQEYAMAEDFESYTDEEGSRIYESWIDGWTNGSGSVVGYLQAPFAEKIIVHDGIQSMPLEYNNVKSPYYSETERTWSATQDWTGHGADTLSLHFRGNPAAFFQRADGTIVMGAGGADIWGTADQFRFAYKSLAGDGSIVARIDSMVAANAWTKVGVMIREGLEANARHVSVVVTPNNGVSFLNRPTAGAASVQVNQTGLTAPYWVKLTRAGDAFTAQRSADGVVWTNITADPAASTVTVSMASSVYIGLAVTSHNTAMQTSVQYSNVATTGTVTGSWQQQAIGVVQPSNSPAALYVTVEDKGGRRQTVTHADLEAATAPDWQPWLIPLSEFSSGGVNLAAVKKLLIGVGDRTNPQPGGLGMLYIDDIGVGHPVQ